MRRPFVLAVIATAALIGILNSPVEAQVMPLVTIVHADTDAGVVWAPPRQFTAATISCPNDQQNLLIQNYLLQGINDGGFATNTTNIRVGGAGLKAIPPVRANGIVVAPGESLAWGVAKGIVKVVSESRTDAGVIVGVVCGYGARQ